MVEQTILCQSSSVACMYESSNEYMLLLHPACRARRLNHSRRRPTRLRDETLRQIATLSTQNQLKTDVKPAKSPLPRRGFLIRS